MGQYDGKDMKVSCLFHPGEGIIDAKSYIPSKVVIVIKGVVARCLNVEVLGSLVALTS